MLYQIQKLLNKEPDEYIDLEIESNVLAVIDDLAFKSDLTRNSMMLKMITRYAKEVLEKENAA